MLNYMHFIFTLDTAILYFYKPSPIPLTNKIPKKLAVQWGAYIPALAYEQMTWLNIDHKKTRANHILLLLFSGSPKDDITCGK